VVFTHVERFSLFGMEPMGYGTVCVFPSPMVLKNQRTSYDH